MKTSWQWRSWSFPACLPLTSWMTQYCFLLQWTWFVRIFQQRSSCSHLSCVAWMGYSHSFPIMEHEEKRSANQASAGTAMKGNQTWKVEFLEIITKKRLRSYNAVSAVTAVTSFSFSLREKTSRYIHPVKITWEMTAIILHGGTENKLSNLLFDMQKKHPGADFPKKKRPQYKLVLPDCPYQEKRW